MTKIPSGARCLACGYVVEWLDVPRCPECGRAFDPGDSSTLWLPGHRMERVRQRVPGWVRWAFEVPLNVTDRAMAGWLLCAAGGSCLWQVSIPLGVLGLAMTAGLTAFTLEYMLKCPRASRRRLARRFAATALVAIALNVGIERCPHATYLSLGPVSVPVAGRACHNPRYPAGMLNTLAGIENPWGP